MSVSDGRATLRLSSRALARLEERQLDRAFSSLDWRRFLLAIVADADSPPLPPPDDSGHSRFPVAVLGSLAGLADLPATLEVFGGRVVYDEWPQLAAQLCLAEEPFPALSSSPLVLGLPARLERLAARRDRIGAVILVTEPFCATAMEEAWFRGGLDKPLLALESESLGPLDATKVSRLESFAAMAFK
jgi:hypothetical protein